MITVANDVQTATLLSGEVISCLIEGLQIKDKPLTNVLLDIHSKVVNRDEFESYRDQLAEELTMLEMEDERI